MSKILPFVVCLLLFATACGKLSSNTAADPIDPPLTPSASCRQVQQDLRSIFEKDPDIFVINTGFLADKSCTVAIVYSNIRNALLSLKKIKKTFQHYVKLKASNKEGFSEVVTLWITEPAITWVPVLGPDGRKLDDTETIEECELTATRLRELFPNAQALVQVSQSPKQTFYNCYVYLEFQNDSSFEDFFSWHNPYSFDGNLMQMHYKRSTGVVATVQIRPTCN
ncbi:MAG: hypothetical protein AB7N80_10745 [Bdellovibrionales bacterium]